MDKVEFAKQQFKLFLSDVVASDFKKKQELNWGSSDSLKRERANLLFSRVEETLFYMANGF